MHCVHERVHKMYSNPNLSLCYQYRPLTMPGKQSSQSQLKPVTTLATIGAHDITKDVSQKTLHKCCPRQESADARLLRCNTTRRSMTFSSLCCTSTPLLLVVACAKGAA